MDFDTKNQEGKVIVPLNLICDAIDMANDEWRQYLDIEKMEVVSVSEYPFGGEYDAEEQELADMIEEGWLTRFFGLPSRFDIDEYNIMEEFIWSLSEGKVQDTLEGAIRGKGAFRRFKDSVHRFGIEKDWYAFQDAWHRKTAIEWCESHGFGYSESGAEGESAVEGTQNEKIRPGESQHRNAAENKAGKRVQKEAARDAVPESGDEENLAWEEISTEHIVRDEWIDFRRSAYRFPDGSVFEPYYSYSRRDYVVVVASDEEGNYLCVRQFRQGIKEVTTEFPAGGIERTDGREYGAGRGQAGAEDSLEAAKRELLEETGYESEQWRHLLTVPSNATIADNYAYIFAAENCRKSGGQKLDETEFLNVRKYTGAEIEEMISRGRFQQAVHIMAWLLARRK